MQILIFNILSIIGCFIASILIRITDMKPMNLMLDGESEEECGAEYCPEKKMHLYNEDNSQLILITHF